jgi:hypothetical protein
MGFGMVEEELGFGSAIGRWKQDFPTPIREIRPEFSTNKIGCNSVRIPLQ